MYVYVYVQSVRYYILVLGWKSGKVEEWKGGVHGSQRRVGHLARYEVL